LTQQASIEFKKPRAATQAYNPDLQNSGLWNLLDRDSRWYPIQKNNQMRVCAHRRQRIATMCTCFSPSMRTVAISPKPNRRGLDLPRVRPRPSRSCHDYHRCGHPRSHRRSHPRRSHRRSAATGAATRAATGAGAEAATGACCLPRSHQRRLLLCTEASGSRDYRSSPRSHQRRRSSRLP
jgi:hypothetical protein